MSIQRGKGKPCKFQSEWLLKFGLEVSTRDITTNAVTSVLCLFCRHHGREDEEVDRKRKLTMNCKYFSHPWRSDNFSSHLKKQHASKWKEYQQLSKEGKKGFFQEAESPEAVTMRSFVQPEGSMKARIIAKQKCKFIIDKDIIDELICGLLLDVQAKDGNEEQYSDEYIIGVKKKCLKYFEEDLDEGVFYAEVKSLLKLNLLTNFVSIGVSFRQATRLYQSVKEETGMGIMGSISQADVANHCRIVCAINLQYLKEMMKIVWAFAISIDAGNNAGTAYLDLRMRCFFKGKLQNLHLLAIPMRERHTGLYQFDLVTKALDVLSPSWRHQLIGVSTDGASSMTGCVQGTQTRLSRECHYSIYRIWCGAHQLDLVMKKAFNELMSEEFISTLTGVTGHLRRQQNLIREMKSTCPMFVSTRWISMGKVLKWLTSNRVRLINHFNTKKPLCTPASEWWIVVEVIQTLVDRVEKTFISMQGMKTLVCEQRQQLLRLIHDIKLRSNVKGPLTSNEIALFAISLREDPRHGFYLDRFCVERQMVIDSIDELGSFVQVSMDELRESNTEEDKQTYDNIVSTIAHFCLQVVAGTTSVCAERDDSNSSAEELPPVLPLDLCAINSRDFTLYLQQQKERLKQKFTEDEIDKIDKQFRNLRLAFREQSGFSNALRHAQGQAMVQSFEDCWSPLGKEYEQLHLFCGGIASVMPGTSSVESDFSLINWVKDPNSQSLTDFSLEAILHCKQYKQLRDLFESH